ncbi:hypothetical protein FA13DRAFT_1481889 [Coprinellus micaceus]|uniref:Uncharacterized protein n=1 Tax=Coprinellus micaceus TaxID=71717 RepID=A0A4Y7TJU2_COPMI|nr:hypothetical protein FA13DRAFT_1481889 [Coprinellus micaceus]
MLYPLIESPSQRRMEHHNRIEGPWVPIGDEEYASQEPRGLQYGLHPWRPSWNVLGVVAPRNVVGCVHRRTQRLEDRSYDIWMKIG